MDGRELEMDGDGFWVGPTLFDGVTADMSLYRDEIFGPVLGVVRVPDLQAAIELINANPYANGTAIFTCSGQAARIFKRKVKVGMIGINVPIPVPMAFYSFGGWKDSLFGDHHIHGPEGSASTRAEGGHQPLARGSSGRSPPPRPHALPDRRLNHERQLRWVGRRGAGRGWRWREPCRIRVGFRG